MNLSFNEEETLVREAVARLLKEKSSFEQVKKIEESERGYEPELWRHMAELDLLGTFFPEVYSGAAMSFIYTAIIMEELGKTAMPSPYLSTVVSSASILLEAGSDAQKQEILPAIVQGDLLVAVAQYEEDGSYLEQGIQMRAERRGHEFVLNGIKMFVADANIAGKLMVAARTDEGVSLFLADLPTAGLTCEKIPTISMDNTCRLLFEDVVVSQRIGRPGEGWEILSKVNPRVVVAKAAEMVGGCKTALEKTVAYSKERKQYGRPVGGYQVLQHYMANMLMAYDTSFHYLYKVVWLIDDGRPFHKEASALKAYVNESYKFITERAIQIHGGIGTTRECDIALFYRGAKSCEYAWGDTAHHYEIIASRLGL